MTLRPAAPGPGPARVPAAFLARWLLLSAVVLGVVTMHHVAAPDCAVAGVSMTHASHADETAAPAGMDGASHSMLHLCLAVLLAVAGLLLAVALAWRAGRGRPAVAGRPGSAGGARPPPWRSGRELLTASCVLRI
ncbi:hypothetical protein OG943_45345 [Amycolatopsis sp. NBC_00345]|uniref:hypothetical protein n=1 Tax=Amycolatopsis sp. NBC_00345 TaxID=2975955 RepID=UPI002E26CA82